MSLGRKSKRTVYVNNGDLLQEKSEVIVNSIGSNVPSGFGGAIGKCIVKECGEKIIKEATDEAVKKYKKADVPVGEFVVTTACDSKNHKFVLHCVCPSWGSPNCEKILKKQIIDILEFWDNNKVESISVPPMSSGILWFPLKNCAKAFFDGIMEFLTEGENVRLTCIKKLNIAIYEKEKTQEFQDIWDQLFKDKYGDDASEIEESGEEASSSEVDEPKSKKVAKEKERKLNCKYILCEYINTYLVDLRIVSLLGSSSYIFY